MIGKKELVTEEGVDKLLKHLSDNSESYSYKNSRETLLKLLQDTRIVLDNSEIDDSIDGTRIRITYTAEISRKGTTQKQGDNILRFQYIKEVPIDYNKTPIDFEGSSPALSGSRVSTSGIEFDGPIIAYDTLDEIVPSLHEVLGLLKKAYFVPEDFSNKLVVERIHKLREMFSKDEILAIPSVSLDSTAGLIPI